ncbi:hypothetical protein FKM82_029239 [Ascaphus truei]
MAAITTAVPACGMRSPQMWDGGGVISSSCGSPSPRSQRGLEGEIPVNPVGLLPPCFPPSELLAIPPTIPCSPPRVSPPSRAHLHAPRATPPPSPPSPSRASAVGILGAGGKSPGALAPTVR